MDAKMWFLICGLAASVAGACAAPTARGGPSHQPISIDQRLVWREDFSSYGEGDLTDWGDGVYVHPINGRNYLATAREGRFPVGQAVEFPDDFQFEFAFSGNGGTILTLYDQEEAPYAIKLANIVTLPTEEASAFMDSTSPSFQISVVDNVLKVYVGGAFAVSARLPENVALPFRRFTVQVRADYFDHFFVTGFGLRRI